MYPTALLNLIVWAAQATTAFGATAQACSESAASILISSLWQGAIVACGLALCLRLAPAIPARLRYAIWAAGFAALVCLPFLPAFFERLAPIGFSAAPAHIIGSVAGSGMTSGSSSSPWLSLDTRWSLLIAALWLAASLVRGAALVAHTIRMRRLWSAAKPVDDPSLNSLLQRAAARRAAPAELCVTTDLDRPCVIGFFRPRILIPAWLFARLTPAELDQIVLHESEHLRRMDDWTNLLQKLCLVVFPLNPALWWLERRLCAEREMACDDGVVRHTQAPRAYAACLAGLAEKGLQRRQAALSLGAWQRRPELATRVHRLLRRPSVLNPAASAVSVALVGCGLLAGTFALAHSPQLVAFVAPVNQASNTLSASNRTFSAHPTNLNTDADTLAALTPASYADASAQPYRAVRTLAIMPAAPVTSLLGYRKLTPQSKALSAAERIQTPIATEDARQTGDSNHFNHSLAAFIPSAVAAGMKAQQTFAPDAQTASQSAEAQSNLTSAKQSSSTQPGTAQTGWIVLTTFEEVQTTGSGQAAQGDTVVDPNSTNSPRADAKTSTSISITRLVLRLVPPTPNVQPGSNLQPVSNVPPASNSAQPIAIPYRDGWLVIQL